MIPFKFKYQYRFFEFWKNIKSFQFSSRLFLIFTAGWIITFYLILFAYHSIFPVWLLLLCITGYFWYRFSRELLEKLHPPAELILVLLLLIYFLHYGWSILFRGQEVMGATLPGGILLFIQIFWLVILFTLFGLLLSQNSKNQIWFIIFYLFLGFMGIQILRLNDPPYWYFYQFVLLLLLFRKTSWAESLTQIECWISLVILLIFYLNLNTLPEMHLPKLEVNTLSWYFLPKILSHFLQLYLLAVLVKIPFVLVYHHATLHRKLQIAGWLQSSIPQFIQLLILLLLFYFFMSAWQAENLKKTMIQLFETPSTLQTNSGITVQRLKWKSPTGEIQLPGFESIVAPQSRPSSTVLELRKMDDPDQKEYFVYFHSSAGNDSSFTLVKIDRFFLTTLQKNFMNISANGLITYPFSLQSWDSVFYHIRIWGGQESQQSFKVFPFAFIPHTFPGIHSLKLVDSAEGESEELKPGTVKIMNQNVFTAGRVYTHLLDHHFQRIGYWSFETVIVLDFPFFTSPLMQQFLFWLLVYALINIFIIQRVIKFGNEINQIILQKFNLLTQGIRQISSGNLDHKISMEGEDEFVELADRFNSMGSDLQKKISDLREMDRLEYELRMAREVQISLLPQNLPHIPGYQVSARMNTATEVGGDFYDVLQLENQNYLFVIGDVSGKGTSAAFYMAQCISLIRFSCQFSQDPREILIRLNHYFSDPMIDKQIFVTAVVGLLDPQKNQVILLRPGHNQPIFIPADPGLAIQELKLPGIGIGLEREGKIFEKTLADKVLPLKKGDSLFFYSDGLVDAYSNGHSTSAGKADFYGDERLINLLQTLRGKQPSEIQERVSAELAAFYGNSPLIDDMTMLILQRTK